MFFFRDPAFIDEVPEAEASASCRPKDEERREARQLEAGDPGANLPFPPLDGYPCQYAGLRINWQLEPLDLKDEADQRPLEKVAGTGRRQRRVRRPSTTG